MKNITSLSLSLSLSLSPVATDLLVVTKKWSKIFASQQEEDSTYHLPKGMKNNNSEERVAKSPTEDR